MNNLFINLFIELKRHLNIQIYTSFERQWILLASDTLDGFFLCLETFSVLIYNLFIYLIYNI